MNKFFCGEDQQQPVELWIFKNVLNSGDGVEVKQSQAFRVKSVSFFFSAPG